MAFSSIPLCQPQAIKLTLLACVADVWACNLEQSLRQSHGRLRGASSSSTRVVHGNCTRERLSKILENWQQLTTVCSAPQADTQVETLKSSSSTVLTMALQMTKLPLMTRDADEDHQSKK